jgi:hypothetical protein
MDCCDDVHRGIVLKITGTPRAHIGLSSPNVRGELPRTAGAPRALAREVPDGRG